MNFFNILFILLYIFKGNIPSSMPYDLENPTAIMELSNKLKEISGLSYSSRKKAIAAVNDEQGSIYFIDPASGKILEEISFWKEGDYEGVEVVDNVIYAVKNTGTLYAITNWETGSNPHTEKINSTLTKENDIEGLGYDPIKNVLLLACKDQPYADKKDDRHRAIYSFYLSSNFLDPNPSLILSRKNFEKYFEKHPESKIAEKFEEHKDMLAFRPSGIAVQPGSGHIYLISSADRILLVLDAESNIIHLEKLKKKIHPQPEGITFDTEGNLFISNEGVEEDRATLVKYKPELKHQK